MDFIIGTSTQPATPPSQEEKTMAMVGVGLSIFAPLIAPLVVWAIQKDKSPYVARTCWRFMVFDGVVMVVAVVFFVVMTILSLIPVLGCLIFCAMIALFGGVGVWVLAVTIIALVRINEGNEYIPPIADLLLPPPAAPA